MRKNDKEEGEDEDVSKTDDKTKIDKDPETTNTPNDIQGGSKSFYGGADTITSAGVGSTIVAQRETKQEDVEIAKTEAQKQLLEIDKKTAAELLKEEGKRIIDLERKKDEIKFSDKKKIDKLLIKRIKQDALMQRLRIIKQILSSDTQTEVEKVRDDINNLIKTESNITNYNVDFLKTTESSLRTLSEEINNLFGITRWVQQ